MDKDKIDKALQSIRNLPALNTNMARRTSNAIANLNRILGQSGKILKTTEELQRNDGFYKADEIAFTTNALDLIPSPAIEEADFLRARAILETNYGTEYSDEKMQNLFRLILEEGWSRERFNRTLAWFRKNKPFPAWTEADWFSYSVPVHTYGWCCKMVKEGHNWKNEIEGYILPTGQTVYKFIDGVELPFKKQELH